VSLADLRGEVAAIREALKPGTFEEQTNIFRTRKRVRLDIKLSHTKIEKHHHYLVEHKTQTMRPSASILFYPNIFYFAVPTELAEHAITLVRGLPYGVFDLDKLAVVAEAKSLRTDPHPPGTFRDLFNRSCVMRRDLMGSLESRRFTIQSLSQRNLT
jgi:hypothetical protein